MTQQQIICFLMLARERSFTRAAEKLYISQPVVSRQISALEQELGFKLFFRTHQIVELTPSGRLMSDFFRRTQDEYSVIRNRAMSMAKGLEETISVALLEFYNNEPILKAVGNFSGANFYVERYAHPCPPSTILSGHFDVGVTMQNLVEGIAGLSFYELQRSRDHLILSRDHALAGKPDLCIGDIKELHLVTDDGIHPANFSEARIHAVGMEHCQIRTMPNLSSVLALVESGLTCTILQEFSLPYISFDYISLPLNYSHSVGLVWRSDDKRDTMKRFLTMCKKSRVRDNTASQG